LRYYSWNTTYFRSAAVSTSYTAFVLNSSYFQFVTNITRIEFVPASAGSLVIEANFVFENWPIPASFSPAFIFAYNKKEIHLVARVIRPRIFRSSMNIDRGLSTLADKTTLAYFVLR